MGGLDAKSALRMKRILPWLALALVLTWFMSFLRPKEQEKRSTAFGQLPVLLNGRVQPLDSVARNSLLQLRKKQTVRVTDRESGRAILTLSAIDWFKEVLFEAELADTRPIFRIDHPEVISLLKREPVDKHFAFADLRPAMGELEREAQRITDSKIKPEQQTPFEKAVLRLYNQLILYQRLKNSLKPEQVTELGTFMANYEQSIAPGRAAARAREEGQSYDQGALDRLLKPLSQYEMVSRFAYPLMIPHRHPGHDHDDWVNAGDAMMEAARSGVVAEPLKLYAAMHDAFRARDSARFDQAVGGYRTWLVSQQYEVEMKKGRSESFFNRMQPFYRAMTVYVAALLLACFSWFNRNEALRRTGMIISIAALVMHTVGLIFRMSLEGRPPVTNLYSSAIFIGWGAVIFGLFLERFYRDGIGLVVSALTGFVTLVIAHNLSMSGDTMEMLQAVLDTNFWLATHVVVVTLGYAATFVAGFLAVLYIIRGFFTSTLSMAGARALSRMVYGVICFATLFSFVGTVLGGIWADQSWGRFWGWDPKENGALLIVLWNAFYLHARWGKIFSEKALMATAVFGNVITAFSWFGVNMLGMGLHSYGFMDAAFRWLMLFDATQLVLIGVALLPLRFWRSFRNVPAQVQKPGGKPAPLVPKPKPA